MIGIVQIGTQQMADRYTYFPLIGPFVAIVWLISELVPAVARRAQILTAAAVTTLAALAVLTFLQVGYWRDTIVLFRHTVASAGENPFATSALAYALLVRGETSEGYALLESVIRMKPKDPQTLYNVGFGMQLVGKLDEAAEYYRATLAINDGDADAHTNLGVIFCQRRQYAKGKEQFLRAIAVNPEQVKAYVNLGILYVETGEYAEAIAFSQHALALDPHLLDCHLNIGVALRAQGRLDEAIQQFQYVLSRSPNDVDARRELARTLAMKRGSGIPAGGVKQ
jgi:tetratricopeptide (TPR) repeat protein